MKKKVIGIIVVILIGFIVMGSCGSTDESTPAEKDTVAEESNVTSEPEAMITEDSEESSEESTINESDNLDAIPVGSKNYDEYLHLGGIYTNGDGIEATVIDVDYSVTGANGGSYIAADISIYVAMEITNNSNEDVYLDQNSAALFVDDYEVSKGSLPGFFQDNGYCLVNDTKQYPTVVDVKSGGRKGIIVFVATIPDEQITETSDIDFEISGLVFKVNPRFILKQVASKIEELTPEEAPERTELNGKTIIPVKEGVYTSESGIMVRIEIDYDYHNAIYAYFSNRTKSGDFGGDFDDKVIVKEEEVPNYFMSSGRGLTITFYEGGLFIEADPEDNMIGDVDGLYSFSGDNVESDDTSSEEGIGNPIIDANPDKYIPEGITGRIDINGAFYSNKPVNEITYGEYLIVGGGNGILTISDDKKASLKFISNEVDFENAEMIEIINNDETLSYQVYTPDTIFVISFYDGGLYLCTGFPDDENDWAEGFYELLN